MSNELKVDVSYVIFVPNGVCLFCIETNIEKQVNETPREAKRGIERRRVIYARKRENQHQVMIKLRSISLRFVLSFIFHLLFSKTVQQKRDRNNSTNKTSTTKNCVCVDGVVWLMVISLLISIHDHFKRNNKTHTHTQSKQIKWLKAIIATITNGWAV